MRKIVISTTETGPREKLLQCLKWLFPECEIEVLVRTKSGLAVNRATHGQGYCTQRLEGRYRGENSHRR